MYLLRALLLVSAVASGGPVAQAGPVVATASASAQHPVAALDARLDASHHYLLRVDGPAGAQFSLALVETYVPNDLALANSGDQSSQLDGTAPYRLPLEPPAPDLRYWHYAVVATPVDASDLTVSVVDVGGQ
jgi:hypothetical protein